MGYTGNALSWLAAIVAGVLLCRRAVLYIRLKQAEERNGCQPPPKYAHLDPILGLDLFLDQAKAMKRGDTGRIERARFSKYGKTFQANSWGTKIIYTMEPTNIQAILAQSFDHFGVEPMRLHIGEPFIGRGVFSTDGAYWRHSRDLLKPMFAKAQVANFASLENHLTRMMGRIPPDGFTDIQALLKLLVRL